MRRVGSVLLQGTEWLEQTEQAPTGPACTLRLRCMPTRLGAEDALKIRNSAEYEITSGTDEA